jgi:hypothetical protein
MGLNDCNHTTKHHQPIFLPTSFATEQTSGKASFRNGLFHLFATNGDVLLPSFLCESIKSWLYQVLVNTTTSVD